MEDVEDISELDKLKICEGYDADQSTVNLVGAGIDLQELRAQHDIEFEVQADGSGAINGASPNVYFDNEEVFKHLNFECTETGDDSEEETMTPFFRMSQDMQDISPTQDKGVLKKILTQGTGPIVPQGSLVRVHYNGYLEYSDEPFDSSRLRSRQLQFKLGTGQQLLGWEIAVATMKRGELARILISCDYAYGKMGCPPRIPAETTVMFEIELISYVDQRAADELENFSEEERKKASFEDILRAAVSLKETGNDAYKNNQIIRARNNYSQALRLLDKSNLKDETEEKQLNDMSIVLILNLCLCFLRKGEYGRTARYARKAIEIDSRKVKGHYYLGKALRHLSFFDDAKRTLLKAQRLSPGNEDIVIELKKLEENVKKFRNNEKKMCRTMLQLDPKTEAVKMEEKKAAISDEVAVTEGMVKHCKDKLQVFKDDVDMTEMTLPICLTDTEISSIEKVIEEMKLTVIQHVDERGEKGMKIIKPKEDHQP